MKPIIGIAANERPMIEEAEHWLSYTPKNFVTHIQQAQGIPHITNGCRGRCCDLHQQNR